MQGAQEHGLYWNLIKMVISLFRKVKLNMFGIKESLIRIQELVITINKDYQPLRRTKMELNLNY